MRTIVVGYDGSEHARRALERAAELAEGGAAVAVVSVVQVSPTAGRGPVLIDPDEVEERRRELEEAVSLLAEKGINARPVDAQGDPATAIVEAAREAGADLVVVGTRGRGLAERIVLGSVSTKVVHEAPCDVLVVR